MAQHNQKGKRLEEITQKREQSTHKTWLFTCKQKNKRATEEISVTGKGDNKKLKSKNTVRKLVGALDDQHIKRTFADDEARVAKISEFFTSVLAQKQILCKKMTRARSG